MSPSHWSSRARLSSGARRFVAPAFVLALLVSGCGGASNDQSAALPVPSSSTDTPCPFTGSDMADALRSSRVVLLRSEGGVCAYGVPTPSGRASLTDPIARIVGDDEPIGSLRADADAENDLLVNDRPDLGPQAFVRYQSLLNGRERATLVFPRSTGAWTVSVDMPDGKSARDEALDRAEGLYDLLTSGQ